MRPVLGIELGLTRCVLALVDDRRHADGSVRVLAHHVVQYEDPVRLVQELRRVRALYRFPRRARVVVWPHAGDPGVTPVDKPGVAARFAPTMWRLRERLRPIVRAGFRVTSALTPAQAAASLAALEAASSVAAGLVVSERGGALAIVSGDATLLTRELTWTIPAPPDGAPLVDRYAFASQVTPHLGAAVRDVRRTHGVRVERVVLCGSAPALRTLAAPLIEELDVEVDTLDGRGAVVVEDDPDGVAGVQLAAAAAIAPLAFAALPHADADRGLTPARFALGAAAALAVIALVLLFWPAQQASAVRRPSGAAARPARSQDGNKVPNLRSAFRGVPAASPANGEKVCARKSVSA